MAQFIISVKTDHLDQLTTLFKEQLGVDFFGPERREHLLSGGEHLFGQFIVYWVPVDNDCWVRTPIVERLKKRLRRLARGKVKFTYLWLVDDPTHSSTDEYSRFIEFEE